MEAHARLVSLTHNLRTGIISLVIEIDGKDDILNISASEAFKNSIVMLKLSDEDRLRVAHLAGVEETKIHVIRLQKIKQILSTPKKSEKRLKNDKK